MLIRQSLNLTAHLAAGLAVGALVYVAVKAMRERGAMPRRSARVTPETPQEQDAED